MVRADGDGEYLGPYFEREGPERGFEGQERQEKERAGMESIRTWFEQNGISGHAGMWRMWGDPAGPVPTEVTNYYRYYVVTTDHPSLPQTFGNHP